MLKERSEGPGVQIKEAKEHDLKCGLAVFLCFGYDSSSDHSV